MLDFTILGIHATGEPFAFAMFGLMFVVVGGVGLLAWRA